MAVKAFATDERAKYAELDYDDIEEACAKAGNLGWLEEAMARKVAHYKYQRVTITDENGKKRKVVDKTLPKILEYRKPTFIELKEMYLVEICGVKPAVKRVKPMTMEEKLALRLGQIEAAKEAEAEKDEIGEKLGFKK